MSCRSAVLPLVLAVLASPAPAADPSRLPDLDRRLDIAYATVNGEKLRLDLMMPKAGGPHPLVVCLHGGAWRFSSRKELSEPCDWVPTNSPDECYLELLASRGYAAASVGYRLAPKSKFPAPVADAKAALRFLRANAAALNLDPDRVAVLGFSAGAHVAAMVACTAGRPEFDPGLYPDQSDRVRCAVNFYGPTDLSLYADTPGLEQIYLVPFLGATASANPDAYRRASPLEYVSKDAPPFLTIHGTADLVVPVIHGERLHAKLVAAGTKSAFLPVKGEGHGWGGKAAAEPNAAVLRFLADHLGPEAK